MFNMIRIKFFILDNNCKYVKDLLKHKELIRLHKKLLDKFCNEYKIEKIQYKYKNNGALPAMLSSDERKRISKEFDNNKYLWPPLTLKNEWGEFLKRNEIKEVFTPAPIFSKYLSLKISNYKSRRYEFNGHIYAIIDGDQIESIKFPDWCREISGEIFYRDLETAREKGTIIAD